MDRLLKTIAVLLALAMLAAMFASPFLMSSSQNQNKVEIHPSDFR
jgi:hypothetical protein